MTSIKLLQHTLPPIDQTWSTGWVGTQMIDQSTSTDMDTVRVYSSFSSNIHAFLRSSPLWAAARLDRLSLVPVCSILFSFPAGDSASGLLLFSVDGFEESLNSNGYRSWIGRHSNTDCPSIAVVFTIAALQWLSRPLRSSWILPSFQRPRGSFSLCTITTSQTDRSAGFLEWILLIERLWASRNSFRYSVLHLFQKWFRVLFRCLTRLVSWTESVVNSLSSRSHK